MDEKEESQRERKIEKERERFNKNVQGGERESKFQKNNFIN